MNLSVSVIATANTIGTKAAAIRAVRFEAIDLIEQAERRAKGWDKGERRDDASPYSPTIAHQTQWSVDLAFELSRRFA